MKNWLELGIIAFLLGMMLYGHYKGFLRLAVSMVSLIATLLIVNMVLPEASAMLKENTQLRSWIEQGVSKVAGLASEEDEAQAGMPSQQRQLIEDLNLPEELKDVLIENNNNEIYKALGVEAFNDYVGSYLVNIVLNVLGFILMFIIVYMLIYLMTNWLDLVVKLPILSGLNKIAGAVLGGVQGVFYLWIISLVVMAFSGTAWATVVIQWIEESRWLSFLYHYNIISKLFFRVILGVLL